MIDITVLYLILSVVLGFAGFFFGRVDGFKKGISISEESMKISSLVSFDIGVCYEREFPDKRKVMDSMREGVRKGLADRILDSTLNMNIKKV